MNHSPLGYLLRRSLLPGKTSYTDANTTLSLSRKDGETLLLFRTDEVSRVVDNQYPESFAAHFDLHNKRRSDLVLMVIRERGSADGHLVRLAAIELKTTADLSVAIEQLSNTLRALKQKLERVLGTAFFAPGNLRGIIVATGSSKSASDAQRIKEFEREFNCRPEVCHPKKEDKIRLALGI
ncbi:MAG: hypothetical protein IPM54_01670 [Polyangiaceae bacterium]|nr:hypothetical protein [Polyangiaceae bacterium]